MVSVAGLFVRSGLVLFGAGFLWLLFCHAGGAFDEAGSTEGRVAVWVGLGLIWWVGLRGGSCGADAGWFTVSVGQVFALVFLMGVTGVLVGSVAGLWGASRGHSGGCWVALVGLGLILVSVVGWLVVGG